MGLFGSIKKAAGKVGKVAGSVAKVVGDPVQKAVRDTVISATKGTPLEGVGKAATKLSAKDPTGSIAKVAKEAVAAAGGAGLLPGPLGGVAMKFGASLTASTSSKPKALGKAANAEGPQASSAPRGAELTARTASGSRDREAFIEYAARKETAGGVF